jgi:hypothetical protein
MLFADEHYSNGIATRLLPLGEGLHRLREDTHLLRKSGEFRLALHFQFVVIAVRCSLIPREIPNPITKIGTIKGQPHSYLDQTCRARPQADRASFDFLRLREIQGSEPEA